ncbi:MAG: Crp/Fnr family transcriptional regulator [gamma proteobacterium endosymbiont of Lamellibrachia anaximandri]|nr:Crp/Fnr family transcriptional regulator [gamma proteobacterium endosymbiont of Lamellibrachia anaximandri]MBL3535120.1 Crp/Fnr family transcriptional regulator [gamma proteobacterium endosymbiont of Lamellibrachia anaximandri]
MLTNIKAHQPAETQCLECPIRKMALFKRVPEDQLESTQSHRSSQITFPSRTHLYREGETNDFVYTLFDGCVKLYKTLQNGKIQGMRFASPGDFLGFQGDLDGAMHHGAIALTDTIVCAFPKDDVHRMLCEHKEIASEMIMKNAQMMAFCQEHLLSTGAKTAIERIAFTLVELNHRFKVLLSSKGVEQYIKNIELPLTQEDLADAVGLTSIHVNRTLKQLKEKQLIACKKGRISVLNEQELMLLANFDPDCIHVRDIL